MAICVSLEKALELQAANYPKPEFAPGQLWFVFYRKSDQRVWAQLQYCSRMSPHAGPIMVPLEGVETSFEVVPANWKVYAPTPDELMRAIGNGATAGYFDGFKGGFGTDFDMNAYDDTLADALAGTWLKTQ